MSKLPVEASEVQEFTPDSLKNILDAPKFRFRAPTERHVRHFRNLRDDEGLEFFSDADFNDERRIAIKLLWTEKDAKGLLEKFETIVAMAEQKLDISDEDIAWYDELNAKLFEHHRRLNVMNRKNKEHNEYAARYVLATYLVGWKGKGIDVPFRLDAGYIPPDDVVKIAKALERIEKQAIADNIEGVGLLRDGKLVPGLAYFELYAEASKLLKLDEDEEKNSPAPSPNSSPAEDGQTALNGESTEANPSDSPSSTSTKSEISPTPTEKKASKTDTPETV